MAFEEALEKISRPAGVDLRAAKRYTGLKLDANGNAVPVAAITDRPIGVLQSSSTSLLPNVGGPVAIGIDGVSKVLLGATVTAGDAVGFKADGTAQTAVSTQYVIGTALNSGAAGDIIPVLIDTANPPVKA